MAKTATKQEASAPPEGDRQVAVLNIKGIPVEVADRFRALATEEGITQAEVLTALVGMYDEGNHLDVLEARAEAAEARREHATAEMRQATTQRDQLRQEVTDYRAAAAQEAQRQVGLSQAGVELLMSLAELGVTKDAVLRWGQALLAADIEPEQAARIMERVGGLKRWADQLQSGSEQLEQMRDKAQLEVAAAKQAQASINAQVEARAKDVAAVEQDVLAARQFAAMVESRAREFGLYADFLSRTGSRVEEMPLGTAMAVAGVVLFTALQNHAGEEGGNPVLQIPPDLQARRPFPQTLRVAELPGLLAPPSVYGAVMRAGEERAAMAREMVAVPTAAPKAAEGGEG